MATHRRKFKVRTGCITCKIRKVKCDEGKPECMRCTGTGRKCDGYAKDVTDDFSRQRVLIPVQSSRVRTGDSGENVYTSFTILPRVTSFSEERWLEYFSQHAGPALSDLADKDFWTRVLPQLSVSEPAIRYALLAVGSSHARFVSHSKLDSAMGEIEHGQSVKHYSSAIANLRRSLVQTPQDVTVPLICCLLFICLECLYGNQPLMLEHLNNGVRLLSLTGSDGTVAVSLQPVKRKLEQIFARLDAQATLYGRPVFLPSSDPTLAFSLEIAYTFSDVLEAKSYLDIITSLSLSFIRLVNDDTLVEKYRHCCPLLLQRRLQDQYMAWRNALDNFDHMTSRQDSSCKDTVTRLRIDYNASFIYLSNCLEPGESSYDAYNTHFATIVVLARKVLRLPEESTTSQLEALSITTSQDTSLVYSTGFSLETSLIPSLYLAAIKCRDPVIRRDAISLLARNNGQEGLWDAKLNCRLARRIVEIEEASMLMSQGATEAFMDEGPSMRMRASNGVVLTDLPNEGCRVSSADLMCTTYEGFRSPRRVTFYTRPNGLSEPEYAWTEDLVI